MRVSLHLLTLLPLLAITACGPAPTPVAPTDPAEAPAPTLAAPAPSMTAGAPTTPPPREPPEPSADFDPIAAGLTVEGMTHLCDDHLAAASALAASIRARKGAPPAELTYDATFGRFDDVGLEVANAAELPYLLAVAHPDAAVREAARLCEPKADAFTTALYLDADLAAVLRAYVAKGEPLTGEKKRLAEDVLRDFRRNGAELPAAKQETLRALNAELTRLGQEFEANINSSTGHIEVRPAALAGLPAEYVKKHPPMKDGKEATDGKVTITIDYPDYFPFITYAKDRKAAEELYVKFTNRGGEENVELLGRVLARRHDKAVLLGYPSWAAFAIEPRMAKTPKAVAEFLGQIRAALREPARREMAELYREHVRVGGARGDKLSPVERYYLQDRVRAAKYKLNTQELSNYFPIATVTKGLLDITAKMYGLTYKEVPSPSVWHPDVTLHEVWSGGERIGAFYLDLYSRPDKFKHAAMFPLRTAKRLRDGRYARPMAALECNFPKPSDGPALMSHEDVVTFFHEFGHVLHHLLTRSELASYSGTQTLRDFVEAPSQMFEEWAWSREVLDLFARHYKTGAKIPGELFAAMQRARPFGRALETQRQVTFATLDFEYHSREPGFDTTAVLEEVQAANDSFTFLKGTHFQSSFGHLIGYDAGYYSYQWALSLSRDILTRFKKEGLMAPTTAAAFRNEVLAKGGGDDPRALLARFLGREPNSEAYLAYLRGKE
jgi:thimet oligopeptidase